MTARNARRLARAAGVAALTAALAAPTQRSAAQTTTTAAVTAAISSLRTPPPPWLPPVLMQSYGIPHGRMNGLGTTPPAAIPQYNQYYDPTGFVGEYQPGGPTATATNAFFQSLGTNGRTCFSCHQPLGAMSISTSYLNTLHYLDSDRDPVFAAVDGADCPTMPHDHSLLLSRGVFRIFLPVPANAQYTIKVIHDPNGCNTNPTYATSGGTGQIISVYRRPRISANLDFILPTLQSFGVLPPVNLTTGAPLATDPFTGLLESGNIMWDGREPTLESQASDATLSHAQAATAPTAAQVAQMVAFERGIYSAQTYDDVAGYLDAHGATGGPVPLPGLLPTTAPILLEPVFNEYAAWSALTGWSRAAERAQSIYRGMQLFNNNLFNVLNTAGVNNVPGVANPGIAVTCALCHGQLHAGNGAIADGQIDLGVAGDSPSFGGPTPSMDLPIFQITCNNGASSVYNGAVVTTNDPGKALITGQCADIGGFSIPQLRGLASHAPYFHDGSAATLEAVVQFYNKRFNIGLTTQNITDMANFLRAL